MSFQNLEIDQHMTPCMHHSFDTRCRRQSRIASTSGFFSTVGAKTRVLTRNDLFRRGAVPFTWSCYPNSNMELGTQR